MRKARLKGETMTDIDPAYVHLIQLLVRLAAIWLLIFCAAWLLWLETKDEGDKS